MSRLVSGAALAALMVLVPSMADAQSQSLFGSSGALSRTGTGGTATQAGGFGSTSSAFGGAAGGGLGSTGLNNTAGAFSGPQFSQMGALSNSVGTGFVGRSTTGGFVGNRLVGQQGVGQQGAGGAANATFNARGGGGAGGRSSFNSFNGGNFAEGSRMNAAASAARTPIVPQYRIAFEHPGRTSAGTTQQLEQRLARLSTSINAVHDAAVQVSDGVVVLRGTVDTEETRRLVETIIRLEPGVKEIDNQLVVFAR